LRVRLWVVATVCVLAAACAAIPWLQVRHNRLMQSVVDDLHLLRQSRVDLAEGFLHLSLGDDPSSPFDEVKGQALLQQAIRSAQSSIHLSRLLSQPLGLNRRQIDLAEFDRRVHAFQGLLDQRDRLNHRDPASETELRVAFYALQSAADRVDEAVRSSLREASAEYGFQIKLSIGLAVFLFSGCCTGLGLAARNKRRSTAALREEKNRLARVAAMSPSVLHSFRLAPDGTMSFPYASPRIQEIYGISPGQLEEDASFIERLWHPDDVARLRAALDESARTLNTWQQQFRVVHPQRGEIWIEGQATPVLEPDGSVVWHGALTDVTALRRNESERSSLEAQLRQAQKMEAIGRLAGGVAHDFNNMLSVIQGNASMLLTPGTDPTEQTDCAKEIVHAAERAAGLTRQLLLFSRHQALQRVELDLNEVVQDMTKMLRRIVGEDITLQAGFDPQLPVVLADRGMIEQILLNLAVNSRDAMPKGGRLQIGTSVRVLTPEESAHRNGAAAGTYACLCVTDTGCGIPPEIQHRIFEPFFTTKEVGKGTGLGLATVYGIVQQHGGFLDLTSQPGQGTTFHVCLPGLPRTQARPKAVASMQDLPRGTETLLVVEDEPALRLLVGNLLKRLGYTVLVAESGVAALQLWQEQKGRIRLLLTDMIMPDGLTGRELALRLLADNPELKVVYTSGYTADQSGTGLTLVEGVNFLQKPFQTTRLAQTLRQALDRT
jgi:signal transduction histidine kinase/ActR/RegA family two-component response regulator